MSDFDDPTQDAISDAFRQQQFYNVDMSASGMRTGPFQGESADHQSDQNYTWNNAPVTNTPENPDPGFQSSSDR
jgi:hypothetical protein